jgi:hypothetical protein
LDWKCGWGRDQGEEGTVYVDQIPIRWEEFGWKLLGRDEFLKAINSCGDVRRDWAKSDSQLSSALFCWRVCVLGWVGEGCSACSTFRFRFVGVTFHDFRLSHSSVRAIHLSIMQRNPVQQGRTPFIYIFNL